LPWLLNFNPPGMGSSLQIALNRGLEKNKNTYTFPHSFVGLFGWKEIQPFLKIRSHQQVQQPTKHLVSTIPGLTHMPTNQDYTATNRNQHLKIFLQAGLMAQQSQMDSEWSWRINKTLAEYFLQMDLQLWPGHQHQGRTFGCLGHTFLASRLHIDVLQVVGDSRIVIEWLSNRGDLQVVSLLAWKDRIRNLQPTFKKLSYIHTHREHNKSVDHLSKEALQKKVGIISYNLWIDGHEGPPLSSIPALRSDHNPLSSTDFLDMKAGFFSLIIASCIILFLSTPLTDSSSSFRHEFSPHCFLL
jgi:hypothetical protein